MEAGKKSVPDDISVEMINELVDATFEGMATKINKTTSSNEVFSAATTLTARTISAALSMGVKPEVLRKAVMELWEMIPKPVAS